VHCHCTARCEQPEFYRRASPVYIPLSLAAKTTPLPSPCPDDLEDNDRPDQAHPLTLLGLPCTDSFQDDPQGTNDYYRLELRAGQSADLTSISTGADYDLVLYDAALTQLAVSKLPGSDDEHIGPLAVGRSGRYYIRVFMRTKSSSPINIYVLRVDIT
jgi:hypothetical protein